ncbi:MAG TPA: IPT/TIG domain-containing protein, partial [Candidatus Paceibacterota bacterium]|nr:IPT/TIG domain-containing protein [Candidatus Paceibacterota bacterium]
SSQTVFAQESVGGDGISSKPLAVANTEAVMCTMDVKQCADGSYVGRVAPKCEFAECPSSTPPATCVDLISNLFVGLTDEGGGMGPVGKLQTFLYPRYLSVSPTGYFGPMTRAAVAAFQKEYGIEPAVGYVGVLTRAKIKELTCGGVVPKLFINSLSPAVAKVGDTVTINGIGFDALNTYIFLDGYRVEVFGQASATQIKFKIPAFLPNTNCTSALCSSVPTRPITPGFYAVQMVNSLGASNKVTLTVTDGKILPSAGAPKILWVDPSAAAVGDKVTIYGSNLFQNETRILFGGVSITSTPVYTKRSGNFDSALEFIVPSTLSSVICTGNVCTSGTVRQVVPGSYELAVMNKYGQDTVKFEVLGKLAAEGPKINSLSPSEGVVGTEVVIRGEKINTGSEKIYFGGSVVTAKLLSTDSRGRIRFMVPEYITPCGYEDNVVCRRVSQKVVPGNYDVVVKNTAGLSKPLSFTVTGKEISQTPVISTVSPSSASVGTQITLTGERLNTGDAKIIFGNGLITPTPTRSNDGLLVFTIPASMPWYCSSLVMIPCSNEMIAITPGLYNVRVVNSFGTSNTKQVVIAGTTSGAPVI